MTPNEYRTAVESLGLTGETAGPLFGYSKRQGYRWAEGKSDIPPSVVTLLRMLLDGTLTIDSVKRYNPDNLGA